MPVRRNPNSNPFADPYAGIAPGEPPPGTYNPGGGTGYDDPSAPPPASTEPPVPGTTETPHPAFDPNAQVGHNGSANGWNREQYRDAWQGSGITDMAGLKGWVAQHGGKVLGDNGTVQTPYGESIDMLINAKGSAGGHGSGSAGWGGLDEGNRAAMGMPPGGGGPGGGYDHALPGQNYPPGGGGYPGGGSGGSGGGSGSGSSSTKHIFDMDALQKQLSGLFKGGAFNQDIVNRRVENANESLQRQRKSQLATDRAMLAERGLIGSGPEITAIDRLNNNTDDKYTNAVSGIYADESEKADSRMMQSLQLAAGLTESEARALIDQYHNETERQGVNNDYNLGNRRVDTDNRRIDSESALGWGNIGLGYRRANDDFTLGKGNLALGNLNAVNGYNLGLGRLGLDRDKLHYDMESGDIDRLMQILQHYMHGADTSAGGYE